MAAKRDDQTEVPQPEPEAEVGEAEEAPPIKPPAGPTPADNVEHPASAGVDREDGLHYPEE